MNKRGIELPAAEIPAMNLDAERAVLGGVLFDAACLSAVRALRVEDFYTEAHRILFTHILKVADSGRPVDLITLQQSLVDAEELADVGGPAGLALVADAGALVIPSYMPTYVELVRDQALKREAGTEFRRLAGHADNGSKPAELADATRALLLRLEGGSERTPGLEPVVERMGDEFTLAFPLYGVRLEFTRTTVGDGARADVRVVLRDRVLDWGNLPLSSTTARVSRAGKLTKTVAGVPWGALLDVACERVAHALRIGEPAVVLVPQAAAGPGYLIEPFLPMGQPSVIHADGGRFKSGIAMALGLAGFHGLALPGLGTPTITGPSLYLDWETDQPTAQRRAYLLSRGLGVDGEGAIVYQYMTGPMVEALPAIRRTVREHRAVLVVVDSLQYAVGHVGDRGDISAPYTQLFTGLRTLGDGVTSLVLAHHSHSGDDRKEALPYGSRFIHNATRSRWELRADREEPSLTKPASLLLGFFHRKANDDWLRPPVAMRVIFDSDAYRIEPGYIQDSPDLLERAPLRQRLAAALTTGALDVKSLAEQTGEKDDTVRRTLERYAGKDWVKLPNTKPVLYGLTSYARA